jgi:hypothetical protein
MRQILVIGALFAFAAAAIAAERGTLAITPSTASIQASFGERVKRRIVLSNGTSQSFDADVVAYDVTASDGTPVLSAPGLVPGGLAAAAELSQTHIIIPPGREAAVDIAFTIPWSARSRAVAALFRARVPMRGGEKLLLPTIGTLITFSFGSDARIDASQLELTPPDSATGLAVSQQVSNGGDDPVDVGGVATIRNDRGQLAGKLALDSLRLLPGERGQLRAEYPSDLPPGRYSVEVVLGAGATVTRSSGAVDVR